MKAIILLMLIPVYCYCNSDASISNILVDQSTVELVLQSEPGKTYKLMTSPDLDVWEESDVFVTNSTNETIVLARTTEPVEFYAFSESPTSPLIQGTLTELITLKRADFSSGGPYDIGITSNPTISILCYNPTDQSVYFMVYGHSYDSNVRAYEKIVNFYKLGSDGVPYLINRLTELTDSQPIDAAYPPAVLNSNDTLLVGQRLYYISQWPYDISMQYLSDNEAYKKIENPFLFEGNEYKSDNYSYIKSNGEKLVARVFSDTESLEPPSINFAVLDSNLSLINVISSPFYDQYGQRFTSNKYYRNYEVVGNYIYVVGNLSYSFSDYNSSESGCAIRKINIDDGTYEDFVILDNPNDAEVGINLFKFNNKLLVYGYQGTYNSNINRDHSFFVKTDLNCVPIWSKFKNFEYHNLRSYQLFVQNQNQFTLFCESDWDDASHFLHITDSGDISIQGTRLSSTFFPSNGGNIFGTDNDYSEPTILMIDVAD